jgi:hypothetical protein
LFFLKVSCVHLILVFKKGTLFIEKKYPNGLGSNHIAPVLER